MTSLGIWSKAVGKLEKPYIHKQKYVKNAISLKNIPEFKFKREIEKYI